VSCLLARQQRPELLAARDDFKRKGFCEPGNSRFVPRHGHPVIFSMRQAAMQSYHPVYRPLRFHDPDCSE
jgi:hypothetical protein